MIEYIDIAHADELDRFVQTHQNCHFMQTSAWGRIKNDWGWTGIVCRNRDQEICGTMALLQHPIRYTGTCLLYAPRGPILNHGDDHTFSELIAAAQQLAQEQKAYLLRIDPMVEAQNESFLHITQELGFQRDAAVDFSLFQPRMCYVTDLQGHTPQSLLQMYSRTKRYDINRAIKRGVSVRMGTAEDLPEFCTMMQQTGARVGFVPNDQAFYQRFLLDSMAKLHLAEKNGIIIAASISVVLGNRMWHMYSCCDNTHHADCANELLQYEMQIYALERGCRWFDFRGVEGYPVEENPKYGLHHYKRAFGAQFYEYAGQLDLVTRPVMNRIVHLLQRVLSIKRKLSHTDETIKYEKNPQLTAQQTGKR